MSTANALLQLKQVQKEYASASGTDRVQVLRGVEVSLGAGESVAIIGPSGCGKSTLLNIAGALDKPDSGSVTVEGQEITNLSDEALSTLRNRRIGFVFQSHHLLPQCSALENVLVPTLASPTSTDRSKSLERAHSLLKRVGLAGRVDHRPAQLSGGERQRVAVVRALINCPALLLADEPTGALDRTSAEQLAELMVELQREEKLGMVVVTHSLELARKMGRVLELRDGILKEVRP